MTTNAVSSVNLLAAAPTEYKPGGQPASGTDQFAGQLFAAIEAYLKDHGAGSGIEVAIRPGDRDGEVVVSMKDTAQEPGKGTSTQGRVAAGEEYPMMMYSGTVSTVSSAAPAEKPPTDVYEAYWATQPPEVRILRDIQDEVTRTAKAIELANEGFAIDVPIMVWRWDPLMTMRARQSAGYTWVPSANQPGVELPPGFSMAGMQEYDPFNPPSGSIRVSTDFAKGLEHTSLYWRGCMDAQAEIDAASS